MSDRRQPLEGTWLALLIFRRALSRLVLRCRAERRNSALSPSELEGKIREDKQNSRYDAFFQASNRYHRP